MKSAASKTMMKVLSSLSVASKGDTVRVKHQRLRMKVIDEIISTEKSYINHLNIIIKFFIEPIQQRQLVSSKETLVIFGPIESILNVNNELLSRCEADREDIANIFVNLAPFLKIYTSYAHGYEEANRLLSRVLEDKQSKLSTFIHQQETRPEVSMKLYSLLITPIQRVPRYKLLLEELIERTPCESEEYRVLLDAAQKIGDVTDSINECLRERENIQYMLTIQQRLTKNRPRIVIPGRKLVKEGVLRKVSKNGTVDHRRIFFLFNDMLMYCKRRGETLDCCFLTPLTRVRLETIFDVDNKKGVLFKLTCCEEELFIFTSNVNEGESWVRAINLAIESLTGARQTLRKESSKNRPMRRKAIRKQQRPASLSQLKRSVQIRDTRGVPVGRQRRHSDRLLKAFGGCSATLTPSVFTNLLKRKLPENSIDADDSNTRCPWFRLQTRKTTHQL
ncbi:LD03170p [Chamberlinius hualienensis]